MGIQLARNVKQKETHTLNKDIKDGTTKKAAVKKETDINHGEATSQQPGLTHHMVPSNGNQVVEKETTEVLQEGMGIQLARNVKQKETHTLNKDIKDGTTKKAAVKKETDINHGEATSQRPGLTHHMVPSNGNQVAEKETTTVATVAPCDLGIGLCTDHAPQIQCRFDECPHHLHEPVWMTTARLAACLALRDAEGR